MEVGVVGRHAAARGEPMGRGRHVEGPAVVGSVARGPDPPGPAAGVGLALGLGLGAVLRAVHGDRGAFEAWINPPGERGEEARIALKEMVEGFDPSTVTQEELDQIRSARRGRLMMRRLSSMGQAYYLAMAELDGDLAGYLEGLTAYDGVTLADLQRVGARYLAPMPLVQVIVD